MKAALAPPETSSLPKAGGNGGRGGPLAGGIGVPACWEALVGGGLLAALGSIPPSNQGAWTCPWHLSFLSQRPGEKVISP